MRSPEWAVQQRHWRGIKIQIFQGREEGEEEEEGGGKGR